MPKNVDCRKQHRSSVKPCKTFLDECKAVLWKSSEEYERDCPKSPCNEAPIDRSRILEVMKKNCH